MAGSQCNAPSSEPAKVEQIITEFFTKSLHIILESRSPCVSSRNYYSGDHFASSPSSSSSTSSIQPRDKWFNLALRDCPAALENLDLWRQSDLEPLIIDVILVKRPSCRQDQPLPPPSDLLVRNLSAKERYSTSWSSGQDELFSEDIKEKIIERWVVQYESRKGCGNARDSNLGGKRRSSGSSFSSELSTMHKKIYRKSILLMRSLYVTVRLLPAYKIFRDLNSSCQVRPLSLEHRISSFVEPFTRVEDAQMTQFSFTPVETPCGRLCLSVSYHPTLEDVGSEPSTPLSTEFITDYVGSPLADPLKRFESLPSFGPPPPHVSFTRRHSWSNDLGDTPSESSLPSPAYSDSRSLHSNLYSDVLPPHRHTNMDNSPPKIPVSQDVLLVHKKTTSFDECWPSPPFSPSPSPSPTRLPSDNTLSALLRTESAPVRIPPVRKNCALPNQGLPPSPSAKGTRPRCYSQADNVRFQISVASTSPASPTERRFQVKQGTTKLGELQTSITLQKVLSCGKTDFGSISGGRIKSCSSPLLPISRSSSRSSLLDEFDDSGFLCPFDIRSDPSDGKELDIETSASGGILPVRKSRDAAVGELVEMLKRAEPLGQDISYSQKFSQASKDGTGNEGIQINEDVETGASSLQNLAKSSGTMPSVLLKSRTTSDALEELKSYREIKDCLLGQDGSRLLDVTKAAKFAGHGFAED